MNHSRSINLRRPAFTLVEMLVVIGIIALLAGLLLPMVMRSIRQAGRMRAQADFQTITFALDAYKQDFGDYPRLPIDPVAATNLPMANTGAATLGKALLGPYGDGVYPNSNTTDTLDPPTYQSTIAYHPGDCVTDGTKFYVTLLEAPAGTGTSNSEYYAPILTPCDGADGPGFRTRPAVNGIPQGKVWGPYLAPGKIKNQGLFLLDSRGNPILYFPAKPGASNVTQLGPTGQKPYVDSAATAPVFALFNANDNIQAFEDTSTDSVAALNRIQLMFGDYNFNGVIDTSAGETAVTLPFVLMSAGSDGLFGPISSTGRYIPTTNVQENIRILKKCDDVTNFQD
jgi:prepilin-type N-terminal cleavage/methylation domain-containing protein